DAMKRIFRRPVSRAALALAAAGLAAWAAAPTRVPGETRTGWLNVVWQTRGTQNQLAHVGLYLVDESGAATELRATPEDLAPLGGLLKVTGRRVTVTGDLTTALDGRSLPTLRVRTLTPRQGPRAALAAAQEGPRAYVTLVCRFPDLGSEPNGIATLQKWMGAAYPGLDHYWRENSENRVSIDAAFSGPYLMPSPSSAYRTGDKTELGKLAQDCTHAADADIDFSKYAGINMQFNSTLWGYSWGGGWTLTLDGQTHSWATTWMASWATQATYAHETGHSLGLPHSSGPYSAVYDSRWDVMSGGGTTDPSVGTRVAPHTIAFHKDLLGWIPAQRKYVARPGATAAIDLVRDALPGAAGYQIAVVPVGATGRTFLTVEARRFAGYYDAQGRLPGEAVILHFVNLDDDIGSLARVVDVDNNQDPNDAGAQWLPGETYTNLAIGVAVRVLSATVDGFRVEISTVGNISIAGDSVLPAGVVGADYTASLTATGVSAGATWALATADAPPGVTLQPNGQFTGVPAQAGTYRFAVRVTDANGFGAKQVRIDVTAPQVAQAAVLGALLSGGTLDTAQQRYLDAAGNRNGRFDVGDVRAWMIEQGTLTP
ncbi:MAG TPA: putative Ig domain-containing protein, partial [Longimicrobium sp.]|nr:putative Ig domain-containing protein [Longimicrobium sp.]